MLLTEGSYVHAWCFLQSSQSTSLKGTPVVARSAVASRKGSKAAVVKAAIGDSLVSLWGLGSGPFEEPSLWR